MKDFLGTWYGEPIHANSSKKTLLEVIRHLALELENTRKQHALDLKTLHVT